MQSALLISHCVMFFFVGTDRVSLLLMFYFSLLYHPITQNTEKYVDFSDTSTENRHSYQQQVSVNSSTSVQTVIFNNSSLVGNDLMAQMNGSESLSSILTRSSNGSIHKQKTLSVSSAEEPLHISDVADLLHQQYAIITGMCLSIDLNLNF